MKKEKRKLKILIIIILIVVCITFLIFRDLQKNSIAIYAGNFSYKYDESKYSNYIIKNKEQYLEVLEYYDLNDSKFSFKSMNFDKYDYLLFIIETSYDEEVYDISNVEILENDVNFIVDSCDSDYYTHCNDDMCPAYSAKAPIYHIYFYPVKKNSIKLGTTFHYKLNQVKECN